MSVMGFQKSFDIGVSSIQFFWILGIVLPLQSPLRTSTLGSHLELTHVNVNVNEVVFFYRLYRECQVVCNVEYLV